MPQYVHVCTKEECKNEQDEYYSVKDFDKNKVLQCKKCGDNTAERTVSAQRTAHYSWANWR